MMCRYVWNGVRVDLARARRSYELTCTFRVNGRLVQGQEHIWDRWSMWRMFLSFRRSSSRFRAIRPVLRNTHNHLWWTFVKHLSGRWPELIRSSAKTPKTKFKRKTVRERVPPCQLCMWWLSFVRSLCGRGNTFNQSRWYLLWHWGQQRCGHMVNQCIANVWSFRTQSLSR